MRGEGGGQTRLFPVTEQVPPLTHNEPSHRFPSSEGFASFSRGSSVSLKTFVMKAFDVLHKGIFLSSNLDAFYTDPDPAFSFSNAIKVK